MIATAITYYLVYCAVMMALTAVVVTSWCKGYVEGLRMEEFKHEYFCDFKDSSDGYLKSIAAEYHRRAEEYDRKVCTGPIINGSVMPASNTELIMINRHTNSLLEELKERASREFGVDGRDAIRAIRKYRWVKDEK